MSNDEMFKENNLDTASISNRRDQSTTDESFSDMIDNEKLHLKNIELIILERQSLLQKLNILDSEIVECMEVRSNISTINQIKSKQEPLNSRFLDITLDLKKELIKLKNYYNTCIKENSSKIEEIETITNENVPSNILERRIKEYKKDIKYMEVKNRICQEFIEKVNPDSKKEFIVEFNKFQNSIDKYHIEKKFLRKKIFFGFSILAIAIAIICISIFASDVFVSFYEKISAKPKPSGGRVSFFKLVQTMGLFMGSTTFFCSIYKLIICTDEYEISKWKALLIFGVLVSFMSLGLSFLI